MTGKKRMGKVSSTKPFSIAKGDFAYAVARKIGCGAGRVIKMKTNQQYLPRVAPTISHQNKRFLPTLGR